MSGQDVSTVLLERHCLSLRKDT